MATTTAPGLQLEPNPGGAVLPGTVVARLVGGSGDGGGATRTVVRLGPGVVQRGREIVATKAGEVTFDSRRSKVAVHTNQRRYEAAIEHMVVAIVIEKHSEEYRVAMHGTDTAVLPALAFEGATKRNKPALQIGSALYCRVTRASKNTECEVSCIEPGSAKSWVGGQTTYGELSGGTLVHVSIDLARALLRKDNVVLATLGKRLPFESAVGVNGVVWINATNTLHTVLIARAIHKADEMNGDEWSKWVKRLLRNST